MNRHLRSIPYFLITIPLFFLLYNHNYYFGLLEWPLLGSEFFFYLTLPVCAFVILNVFIKPIDKTEIIIAVLTILFYFFQPIQDFLKSTPFPVLGRYFVLLPILLSAVIMLVLYVTLSKTSFGRSVQFINVLFLLLIGYELSRATFYSVSGYKNRHDLADERKRMSSSFKACDTCMMPDIYFFVFDEYTNQKTLISEFRYQNQTLTDYLQGRGFFVGADSRSNYNQTLLSLSSEMNLRYLPSIYNGKQYYARDFLQGAYTVYHNELCIMLRKQGYKIANYSIFDIAGAPRHSPRPSEDEFLPVIFKQTLLKKIEIDIGWNFRAKKTGPVIITEEQQRNVETDMARFNVTFQGVLSAVRRKDNVPLFTYAHFLLPHRPYYFDSTGNRLADSLTHHYELEKNKGYVHQTVYANNFYIKPLVDSIFAGSSRPFIVILQGDHGFRGYPEEKKELEFKNLNAFYFHDQNYEQLYPQISSVNTFRVIFNKYFGTRFALLKDSVFYLPSNLDR